MRSRQEWINPFPPDLDFFFKCLLNPKSQSVGAQYFMSRTQKITSIWPPHSTICCPRDLLSPEAKI